MTRLYGVIPGLCINHPLIGSRDVQLTPSANLIAHLTNLPQNERVGVEFLNPPDREVLANNLITCGANASLKKMPSWSKGSDGYWQHLINSCDGYEVIFLDDFKLWTRLNESMVDSAKARERRVINHRGESEARYHRRFVQREEKIHKAELASRSIQEIERSNSLLKAIRESNLDAVAVSKGYSDYWMMHPEEIERDFGIRFEGYSTETYFIEDGSLLFSFKPEAIPDKETAYERESLMRMLKVIGGKRISDKTPDFIGTWDVLQPSRGYYEMFIEDRKSNGRVFGKIEDCLGRAIFDGRITENCFNFNKFYENGCCVTDAIHQLIKYRGAITDGRVHGYFHVNDFGTAFYMTECLDESPMQMSVNWHELASKNHK